MNRKKVVEQVAGGVIAVAIAIVLADQLFGFNVGINLWWISVGVMTFICLSSLWIGVSPTRSGGTVEENHNSTIFWVQTLIYFACLMLFLLFALRVF